MTLAKLKTFSLHGIAAVTIEVEVDVSAVAMPKTILVGLPEAAVRESTHRIARAIVNSGFEKPRDRIVINLAPAELPKQAATFDLPIALGMLIGSHQLPADLLNNFAIVGELALEGRVRPAKGVLSMAIQAAREKSLRGILVPRENAKEAAVVESIEVIPVGSLAEAVAFLSGELNTEAEPSAVQNYIDSSLNQELDYDDVRGQEMAKRAITIAAAGSHNLLMVGPPGSGKSMLAKRISSIMPTLTPRESIEITQIYSSMGKLPIETPLMVNRPFRSPHHTVSEAGLVGGGNPPAPGEISLSHNGVLFLDELPEFNRRTLEVMRQPLEDGQVTISRAMISTTFPAAIMLITAMNPCPCGYRNEPRRACRCSARQIEGYMAKVSGPLLDRIDIHVEVPAAEYKELSSNKLGTSSQLIRDQVETARAVQKWRFADLNILYNAQMSSRQLRTFCKLTDDCIAIMKQSVNEMGLSARAHDKILRVSRTIADIEQSDEIQLHHLAEAINYRQLDRQI
ncbi:YifB family Mg chelatase-like AAA ATPase [bacterium]|nr:YifB family Mg chelatase-like AAA ATPase [bacterium]